MLSASLSFLKVKWTIFRFLQRGCGFIPDDFHGFQCGKGICMVFDVEKG